MIEYLVFECPVFAWKPTFEGDEGRPGLQARLNALIAEGWEKDYLQTFSYESSHEWAHVVMKREKPEPADRQPEAGPVSVRSDEGFAAACTERALNALGGLVSNCYRSETGSLHERTESYALLLALQTEMSKRKAGQ